MTSLVKKQSNLMYICHASMTSWRTRTKCTVCHSSKNTLTALTIGQTRNIICDVDDTDVLKMSMPSEDILSGKAAIVRVKLSLDSGEVNDARSAFRVSIKNVCWVDEGEGPVTNLKLVVYNKLIDTFSCFYITSCNWA